MPTADLAAPLRDDALPTVGLLTDPSELAAWLGEVTGDVWEVTPLQRRYKPGTSLVLSFRGDVRSAGTDRTVQCVARVYSAPAAVKLDKTLEKTARTAVVAHDPGRRVLVTTAAGDRDLPLLPLLERPDGPADVLGRLLPSRPELAAGTFCTLRHNPERRWVGVVRPPSGDPVLLRAYRRGRVRASVWPYKALRRLGPRTPRLLAASEKLGVAVVKWVEGRQLDAASDERHWVAAGRALARLHDTEPTGIRRVAAGADAEAVLRAGDQLAALLPDLAPRVSEISSGLARLLSRVSADDVVIHGDFSADQVVVKATGSVVLIDLDAVRHGSAAADLGCGVATARLDGGPEATAGWSGSPTSALLEGYAEVRRPPEPFAVAAHEASFLFRKAAEPFRMCRSDWATQVERRLLAAEQAYGKLV
jgi:aminoglycoside phosphotransferase (APT) family kinase protein